MAPSGRRNEHRRIGAVAAASLIAAVVLLAACLGSARAATITFSAALDGGQETPPNGSGGLGSGSFVMDTVANTLSYNIYFGGLSSAETAAHIHGYAGPGVPAPIVFPFALGNPKSGVWNYPPADEPSIIAGLSYANIHTTMFMGGEIRGQILRLPSCGDGIVDGGETCDDGNTADGDCCSSTCQYDAAGTTCIGATLCDAGFCDGLGSCDPAIRTTCRSALKSLLLLKNSSDDEKDKLVWKWLKGAATTLEELGVPTATTAYALCIYSGTSAAAIAEADIPPSATLWQPSGSTGFKYKDPARTQDGIQKALLKAGAAGKAKALVKGKGTGLPDPPAGPLTLPITAQLVNSGNIVCFEGVYDTADVIKNEADQFKAKAQ